MTSVHNRHPAIIQPTPPLFQFFLYLIPTGCRTPHRSVNEVIFMLNLLHISSLLNFCAVIKPNISQAPSDSSFCGGFPCKKGAENPFLYVILSFGQFLIGNKKFLFSTSPVENVSQQPWLTLCPCGTCFFIAVSSASCWPVCSWFFKSIRKKHLSK